MSNARKTPAARAEQAAAAAEASDMPIEFEFDGQTFAVRPSDLNNMEIFGALAELQEEDNPVALAIALRKLLGPEAANRLFRGRQIEDMGGFFDAMGEAVGSGNS